MTSLIFVYGTLKAGFPNAHRNPGRREGGRWRTVQALPLYVVELPAESRAPWLVDAPGQGTPVTGELYAVDAATLAALDAFEETDRPDGYARQRLAVVRGDDAGAADAGGAVVQAWVWCKSPAQLAQARAAGWPVEGPHAEFTAALAEGYRLDG